MSAAFEHRRYEQVIARILRSPDPQMELSARQKDRRLSRGLRNLLLGIDAAGLRITALLVARLRFERLLHGCPEAAQWFDKDTAVFADAFRCYHDEVPPTAWTPQQEAALWRRWTVTRAPGPDRAADARARPRLLTALRIA